MTTKARPRFPFQICIDSNIMSNLKCFSVTGYGIIIPLTRCLISMQFCWNERYY